MKTLFGVFVFFVLLYHCPSLFRVCFNRFSRRGAHGITLRDYFLAVRVNLMFLETEMTGEILGSRRLPAEWRYMRVVKVIC